MPTSLRTRPLRLLLAAAMLLSSITAVALVELTPASAGYRPVPKTKNIPPEPKCSGWRNQNCAARDYYRRIYWATQGDNDAQTARGVRAASLTVFAAYVQPGQPGYDKAVVEALSVAWEGGNPSCQREVLLQFVHEAIKREEIVQYYGDVLTVVNRNSARYMLDKSSAKFAARSAKTLAQDKHPTLRAIANIGMTRDARNRATEMGVCTTIG